MAAYLRSAMRTHIHRRTTSNDYLERATNLPHMNNALVNLVALNEYHMKPLDEETSSLNLRISALSFLPPPKAGSSFQKNEDYVSRTKNSEMEYTVGEVAEKRGAIDKKTFTKGRQSSYLDAVATISNMEALYTFQAECHDMNDKPDIIKMLRSLADVFSGEGFRTFAEKYEYTLPWICHSLVCHLQTLLAAFASVASNLDWQQMIEYDEPIGISNYEFCWEVYWDMKKDVSLAIKGSNPRSFATAPDSYQGSSKRKIDQGRYTRNDRLDDKRSRRGDQDQQNRGWLIADGQFRFPRTLSIKPCMNFALESSKCTYRSCSFEHGCFPDHFNRADRKIMFDWAQRTNNVRFAKSVDIKKIEKEH